MKARFSKEKAEWGNEREDWYRKECEKIAFDAKAELIFRENKVYLSMGKPEIFLC